MTTGLETALVALWRQHRPEAGDVVPIAVEREPERPMVGTQKAEEHQQPDRPVPAVPTVPTISEEPRRLTWTERMESDAMEWQERAAVLEFSGGLTREEAERQAAVELNYHRPQAPAPGARRRLRF